MAHLIDKDALVAEIESKKEYAQTLGDNAINSSMQQFYDGMKQGCVDILSFIDSLQEEPAPKILEDMLNAKTPAESLGISQEEHDRIVDELIYGKESEMVDIDDLPKEEPISKVWHDASNLPYNSEAIVIEHSEYGTSIVPACKMSRVKGAKWALLEDILKL